MITDLYPITATTKRLSYENDAYGGETATWSNNLTSYKCRIYKPSGMMDISDIGKIEGKLFKAIGEVADILVGDKLIDGTKEYIVKRVYPVYAYSIVHHYELLIDKIK